MRRNGDSGLLSLLSRRPKHVWPEGVIHHGARALLLLVLAVLTTVLFPPATGLDVGGYAPGTVADETVIARVPFEAPPSAAELARARRDAAAAVPPTFDYRPEAAESTALRLEGFFDRLDQAANSEDPAPAITRLLEQPTSSQVEQLLDPEVRDELRRAAVGAARDVLGRGVAPTADVQELTTDQITVRTSGEGEVERSVPRSEILSAQQFYAEAAERLPPDTPPDLQDLFRVILIQNIEFTYDLNTPATELDRDQAERAVTVQGREYLQGEAIVRANEAITPDVSRTLEAYQEVLRQEGLVDPEESEGSTLGPWIGAVLLNVLLLGVFGLLLLFFRREIYTNARWTLLMAILVGVYIGGAAIVARNGWPVEALPVAFVALAVAVLWDGRMALVLAMTLAVLSGVQPGLEGVPVVVTTLLGGSAAAMSVRAVRRRAQTWIFIAIITAAYAAAIVALTLVEARETTDAFVALGAGAGNAVLSAIVAMGFLPVFEWFTGVTTDQTLLEWADPNRDLLRRLSMEAPGTYAHTINVANLAEAAANSIGANGLLCRVGLYYHDVGKVIKPHYFVENQPDARNPHDRLKPDTSAAIVKEHVTEGHRLAREAGVPDIVADFVLEHHGTQAIGFFLEKAREEYGEENVDVADFTYPGPRPRSKETAIAMLADSVESATRALQDPTPERIRGLIDSLVDAKIADEQLDEAPLTLMEIAQIKDQFAKVLGGVYHHRIDYPQTRHLTESTRPGADESGEVADTGGESEPPPASDDRA